MKKKIKRTAFILISLLTAAATAISVSGCAGQLSSETETTAASDTTAAATLSEATQAVTQTTTAAQSKRLSEVDITINDTLDNSEDGGHAITADGESADYSHTLVTKTGDSSGDNADFYGENAAIFATNGGTLNLSNMVV